METKINFTSAEKKDLRKWYAHYKSAENKQERLEVSSDFQKEYSQLELNIFDLPEHIYSSNQLIFIEDAENSCLEIDYGYSGRGMYGDVCPCVRCDSHNDLKTTADTRIDSMGLGIVIYAQF
jgi:hypothetical protein